MILRGGRSFPEAELAEDGVQQIVGGCFADDFSDCSDGDAQIQGHEFEAGVGIHGLECVGECDLSAAQCLLVARIDGDLAHFTGGSSGPDPIADLILQFFDSLQRLAADFDGL